MKSTYQSIVVPARVEVVWGLLCNFHDMTWAPNVIKSCRPVGDIAGSRAGARRILNEVLHETLLQIDEKGHKLRYSIDDGPPPVSPREVSNYVGTVHLFEVTEGDSAATFVEWHSTWESDDDGAVDYCHGMYVALLAALVDHFS